MSGLANPKVAEAVGRRAVVLAADCTCRLDRVNRRYVAIPKTDKPWRAYQESLTARLDLPAPLV
jgi:hypothetical protein